VLRWAILGTGFISNEVIQAIDLSDGSSVELIAGRNLDKTADFQDRYDIGRSASLDQAVADPNIDAVYIGLPNHQHHPYAIAAARNGKAVLSEKSLTTTLDSANELIAAVQKSQTFFVEGLMYLAHPLYLRVHELLTDGRLGELRSISGRYGAAIAHLVNPAGQGTIYNLGCYPVSLTQLVLQTVCGPTAFSQRAIAATGNTNPQDGTVCDAALTVRFDNGVLATLQSSDNYGIAAEFSIAGDNGVLRFETNPWLPVAGENRIGWTPHEGTTEIITVAAEHDAFFHQIKMVERAVQAGDREATRPSPRHRDSLEIMELLTEWEAEVLTRVSS